MCLSPKIPDPPPPPAQRQATKEPMLRDPSMGDPKRRRRGYAALMMGAPSLQPPATTATLGG